MGVASWCCSIPRAHLAHEHHRETAIIPAMTSRDDVRRCRAAPPRTRCATTDARYFAPRRPCRHGAAAVRSRRCRGAVTALSRCGHGAVAVLPPCRRGAVMVLSRGCHDATAGVRRLGYTAAGVRPRGGHGATSATYGTRAMKCPRANGAVMVPSRCCHGAVMRGGHCGGGSAAATYGTRAMKCPRAKENPAAQNGSSIGVLGPAVRCGGGAAAAQHRSG